MGLKNQRLLIGLLENGGGFTRIQPATAFGVLRLFGVEVSS